MAWRKKVILKNNRGSIQELCGEEKDQHQELSKLNTRKKVRDNKSKRGEKNKQ
jgi:hypothetical protein